MSVIEQYTNRGLNHATAFWHSCLPCSWCRTPVPCWRLPIGDHHIRTKENACIDLLDWLQATAWMEPKGISELLDPFVSDAIAASQSAETRRLPAGARQWQHRSRSMRAACPYGGKVVCKACTWNASECGN